MGERAKSLAKVAIQRGENAIELNYKGLSVTNTKGNHVVCEGQNYRMEDSDLLSDDIVSEHLTRNVQFFGLESQHKVTRSYVVVIGLGRVRSHAASMLLCSGVGRLLLVDFDQVSLSSLNRHAVATRSDVGIPKAQCLRELFLLIFTECQIEAKVLLYDALSEDEILSDRPGFVMDYFDNIDTKILFVNNSACVHRGLKVLSTMGAGARADPTRIHVADLRESINDPLSRSVRHRLKRDHGIEGGIPVVFSLEKPKAKLLPFNGPSGDEENPSDYQQWVDILRELKMELVLPKSYSYPDSIELRRGLQVQTEPVVSSDLVHYRTLHQRLIEHEESLYGTAMQVQVDVDEVMYITKELWHGRSARESFAKDVGRGMWRSINELMLVRWDREKSASVTNLVLLKFKEVSVGMEAISLELVDKHESRTFKDIKEVKPYFFNRVIAVLKRAEEDFGLQLR
ncbi:Ubiquitin-activating enzyme E [Parasponia andersonii]|uniref:Ubiquitin-activating enzyme E n=1 Tax=Parasponia andersonii TaxID=3476 RepID=A0A2P5B3M2_PARAD|nr:Ubiquitin-activating enzyme E [Parasponia andersonii]